MTPSAFDDALEALLVFRNPRGMQSLRAALSPGYYRRGSTLLAAARRVLIGTGFPVAGTFENDTVIAGPDEVLLLAGRKLR